MIDGILHVVVFPNHMSGGQCTAMTKRKARCRNEVWEHGQVAGWVEFTVAGVRGSAYGPLDEEVGQRYLTQRCRLHSDAAAFCEPEWELLTLGRHRSLLE